MEDNMLAYRLRHGDRNAFNVIVKDYHVPLVAFACRIVADREAARDIVQDVLVNLWLKHKKIKPEVPLPNLLYLATRNTAYNYLRSLKRKGDHLDRIPMEDDDDVTAHMAEMEAVRQLRNAVGQLPERTRGVILLTLEGLKQEEIAAHMNLEISSVKTLKALGIRKLRQIIDPLYSPDKLPV